MRKKFLALILSAGLMSTAILGCGNDTKTTESSENTQASENVESSENADSSNEADASVDTSGDESAAESEAVTFDFSEGLDDNGFVSGVTAKNYVTIPDFKEITLAKSDLEPSDDIIQSEIDSVLTSYPVEVTDRAIEDGDSVNIDYEGKVDGVAFEGGAADGATVTAGSTEFIDDFLTQIIGHKIGETFDVNVTFPDPYTQNSALAGKDAVFTVTINSISEAAELTDDFVKTNLAATGCTTVDELKAYIHDYYYNQNLSSAISTKLSESTYSEIPENAYNVEYNTSSARMYSTYGITMDDYVKNGYMTEDEVKETLNKQAVYSLVCQAIAEDQDMNVTSDDFEQATGTTDNESYIQQYGSGYIARIVLEKMVMEYVEEQITIQ